MFMRFNSSKKNGKWYTYIYLARKRFTVNGTREFPVRSIGKVSGYEPSIIKPIFERDYSKCQACERFDNLTLGERDGRLVVLCFGCIKHNRPLLPRASEMNLEEFKQSIGF